MKHLIFYGNLYECPWAQRLENCPVNPVADLTFEEKYNWFTNLNDSIKDKIMTHHQYCSKARSMKKILK